jgi:hypothetical protein
MPHSVGEAAPGPEIPSANMCRRPAAPLLDFQDFFFFPGGEVFDFFDFLLG